MCTKVEFCCILFKVHKIIRNHHQNSKLTDLQRFTVALDTWRRKGQIILSSRTTLSYIDPEKDTVLYVDGGSNGLGAILSQVDKDGTVKHLCYASYPLTATEVRYPQINREALSILWSIRRFHIYVITDHQPIVSLFNNPSSKPTNWMLTIGHSFTVEYQPGSSNPADLSIKASCWLFSSLR